MRQVLRAGALGRPRGMGWGGRWEGGLGWGIHVNPWLIHVSVWQKPLQYCKLISLQLIKIIGRKKFKNKKQIKEVKKKQKLVFLVGPGTFNSEVFSLLCRARENTFKVAAVRSSYFMSMEVEAVKYPAFPKPDPVERTTSWEQDTQLV